MRFRALYDDTWRGNFFIEMDRGNTNWGHKIAYYERARRQSDWRQQLRLSQYPTVLCVTPKGEAAELRQMVQTQKPMTQFWVKEWDDLCGGAALAGWVDALDGQMGQLIPG